MSPEFTPSSRQEFEARLTALLLGELTGAEAASLRQAIEQDAELAALYERLKKTVVLVREVAANPAQPAATTGANVPLRLSEERRQKLFAQFKTVRPKEFVKPPQRKASRTVLLLQLAALLMFMAVLAGLLLPSLAKSKSKATNVAILDRLRQLDGAKQEWALENKKSPDAVPTFKDIEPYMGRGDSQLPKTLAGEKYILGPVGKSPVAVIANGSKPKIYTLDEPQEASAMKPTAQEELLAENKASEGRKLSAQLADRAEIQAPEPKPVPALTPLSRSTQPRIYLPTDSAAQATPSTPQLASSDSLLDSDKSRAAGVSGVSDGAILAAQPNSGNTWNFASPNSAPAKTEPQDPEWIGLLNQPKAVHSATNPFVGSYSFYQTPADSTQGQLISTNSVQLSFQTQPQFGASALPPNDAPPIRKDLLDQAILPPPRGTVSQQEPVALAAGESGRGEGQKKMDGFNLAPISLDLEKAPPPPTPAAAPPLVAADQITLSSSAAGGDQNGRKVITGTLQKQARGLDREAVAAPKTPVRQLAELAKDRRRDSSTSLNLDGKAVEAEKADAPLSKPAAPAPEPQPEVLTSTNAFSTFSLNIADVSFKLAAASLEKGVMPEPASIRSEEFINAFDYRDPEAPPGVPVAFAWERAHYPFAQNRDLLRFSLKTAATGRAPGRPLNIVLLLDNSGSMERADRVQIIHEALRVLASQLQPQDTLSIVTFARTAHLFVDGVPGNQAADAVEKVSGLTPQGGTNLEEAMRLAYETALRHYLANGVNRVVLMTDGAANLGNVDPAALKANVETHRKQGVALDCFGIGWEGYNDDLLEVLARNGDGRYGFLNSPEEAANGFAHQLAGALNVAAADVKVQVEFNPQRVTVYRQIGYAKLQLTKEQFRDNTVDAAEIGAAEAGNALYVLQVDPNGQGPLGTVRIRYKIPGTEEFHEHEWSVPYNGSAVALEQASPAMRLAATASGFSEWLANSPYAAEVTPDALLKYLSGVPAIFEPDGRPKQLEWMIRTSKSISGK